MSASPGKAILAVPAAFLAGVILGQIAYLDEFTTFFNIKVLDNKCIVGIYCNKLYVYSPYNKSITTKKIFNIHNNTIGYCINMITVGNTIITNYKNSIKYFLPKYQIQIF